MMVNSTPELWPVIEFILWGGAVFGPVMVFRWTNDIRAQTEGGRFFERGIKIFLMGLVAALAILYAYWVIHYA